MGGGGWGGEGDGKAMGCRGCLFSWPGACGSSQTGPVVLVITHRARVTEGGRAGWLAGTPCPGGLGGVGWGLVGGWVVAYLW